MKKNILYIGIALVIGLFTGWLIFGGNQKKTPVNKNTSSNHKHSTENTNYLWTCAMHPQIKHAEKGDCPICGMELTALKTSTKNLSVNKITMTKNAMALANIQTSIIGNTILDKENEFLSLSGKVAINEENNTVQTSYFNGRIEQLHVNYKGQKVNRGQLLATIYSPNLIAAQQELITTYPLKKSQPALYNAVRNKLKLWKLSQSQINNIEQSGKIRLNFPIYATVSGTVSSVMTAKGDYVKQGQPIVKLNNLNSVWVTFDAYENQIKSLQKGQTIKLITNAYPNKKFEGIISFIDPILNNETRTISIRALLPNKNGLLKPGMFVTGKLKRTSATLTSTQLLVPASAVMWTGKRSLVYVKTNPNKPIFEMREVTIGNRSKENYIILSGLKNGDEIVTNGTFTIDAAAQLQGKKSMMGK